MFEAAAVLGERGLLKIDHVTIAGPRLEAMQAAFAGLGFTTDYGGPHSNGITHMALLGFRDGSYIELISSLEPGRMALISAVEVMEKIRHGLEAYPADLK